MKPLISVIIRTYNEERTISQCLAAVFRQKIDYPVEVIIVDSQSQDQTLVKAAEFPVKIIKIKKQDFSYGRALNFGAAAAFGKYLVCLSAHALPVGSDWSATLLRNFKSQKVAGVYSKEIPFTDCNPLNKRQILAHNQKILKFPTKYLFFSNAGSMIAKEVWQKIKFDETLIASEDYDWAKRAKAQDYEIIYEPKAIIYHSHHENFNQIYQRYCREFYSNLLIENKKFSLNYLTLGIYHFGCDIIYILKNKYSLLLISQSLANNSLLFWAAFQAVLKRLIGKPEKK